jgi:hypothetical protein
MAAFRPVFPPGVKQLLVTVAFDGRFTMTLPQVGDPSDPVEGRCEALLNSAVTNVCDRSLVEFTLKKLGLGYSRFVVRSNRRAWLSGEDRACHISSLYLMHVRSVFSM